MLTLFRIQVTDHFHYDNTIRYLSNDGFRYGNTVYGAALNSRPYSSVSKRELGI
jgi:hypothetical protein